MDSLGWVYFKKGEDAMALKYLQKALRIVPSEPTILYHIGEVYLDMGDRVKALGYFERALKASEKKGNNDPEELVKFKERIEFIKGNQ